MRRLLAKTQETKHCKVARSKIQGTWQGELEGSNGFKSLWSERNVISTDARPLGGRLRSKFSWPPKSEFHELS